MTSNESKVLAEVNDNPILLSPMGSLTLNFTGSSLSSTPRLKLTARRLSMSNLSSGTPENNFTLSETAESKCSTPRLSKSLLRSNGRRSSLIRRMNSAPVTLLSDRREMGQDSTILNKSNNLGSSPAGNRVPESPSLDKFIDNHDYSSRDSGYATEEISFRFVEPHGVAPKKSALDSPKPSSYENFNSKSPKLWKNERKFSCLSFDSTGSCDDGFLEVWDLDKSFSDENELLPAGLGNLLKGPLLDGNYKNCDEEKGNARPPLRRFNSLVDNYTSPASSKAKMGLFRDDVFDDSSNCDKLPFKRPRIAENYSSNKKKSSSLQTITERVAVETSHSRYKLQRSISETAASSLSVAFHKSDLIGDFSRPYALPIISGRHEDLKSISSDTLADLINGEFRNKVDSFRIIDCRYPYEYEGGHIKGSINLYTKEQVEHELFDNKNIQNSESLGSEENVEERNILIFHCEFSLERGPALYRFLRRCDRSLSSYPSLHYPEVYLLHGGYESFFSTHKYLCEPCFYQPMVDPKHENDLRKFRVKSNSWSGDMKRQSSRSGLKRLGLF